MKRLHVHLYRLGLIFITIAVCLSFFYVNSVVFFGSAATIKENNHFYLFEHGEYRAEISPEVHRKLIFLVRGQFIFFPLGFLLLLFSNKIRTGNFFEVYLPGKEIPPLRQVFSNLNLFWKVMTVMLYASFIAGFILGEIVLRIALRKEFQDLSHIKSILGIIKASYQNMGGWFLALFLSSLVCLLAASAFLIRELKEPYFLRFKEESNQERDS